MGISEKEGLFCKACCSRKAAVQKIREGYLKNIDDLVNVFAVVCPSCEARGYHSVYKTHRTIEQNDALAQDKAARMWMYMNGEG